MKLYLIWIGSRNLLGEIETYVEGEKNLVLYPAELKSYFVPYGDRVKEVYNLTPVVPTEVSISETELKPDWVYKIEPDKELYKLYYSYRAEIAGLSIETDINKFLKRPI